MPRSMLSPLSRSWRFRSRCSGAADAAPGGVAGVYRLGDWPAPFAIVLVVDRLAALMLLLTSLLAAAAVVFSLARWHRVGVLFHPLFQFLLMGINGAFLTGDLFNLFVFFEVLLAASYGLGAARLGIRAGSGRVALHRRQPRGLAVVSDRRQPDLRRGRHAQHGRSRRAHPGDPRRGSRVAGSGSRHPGDRVPGQGGNVAPVLLAARHLCRRAPASGVRSSQS